MCRVYSAVIVDVGSEPQQQVDQLVVAQTQRNLKDAKTGSDRQQGLSEEDQYVVDLNTDMRLITALISCLEESSFSFRSIDHTDEVGTTT